MAKKKKIPRKGDVTSMVIRVRRARIDDRMLDHAKKLIEKENNKKPGDAELRKLGFGNCIDHPSFTNIDNAITSAKLRTNYARTLKMLVKYFQNNDVIGRYIADKYICEYVRNELANKYFWDDVERFLAILVKDSTGIDQPKKKTTFNYLKEKSYMLQWNDVTFSNGYYTIHCPQDGSITFQQLKIYDKAATSALNYIRDYLQEKMPRVFCSVQYGKLQLPGSIDLSIAIRMQESPTYSKIVGKKVAMRSMIREVFREGVAMSYADSMSKARQLSPADFAKYKSTFISYLVKHQIGKYRIIPCNEEISHQGSSITENAFIFTLPSNRWINSVILVVENLNADRATLLFRIDENRYERCLETIHAFLRSTEINKRSNLRENSELIRSLHANNFYAVNHRDDGPFPWRSTMEFRLRNM